MEALQGSVPVVVDTQPSSPWHYVYTFALAALIVFLSITGAGQQAPMATRRGHVFFYSVTIAAEFFILGLTYIGMRLSKMTMREVIGGRWQKFEDFLLDVAIAFGFWIVLLCVVGGLAYAMHLNQMSNTDEGRQTILAIGPKNAVELALFICLSVVAGFVEEIVYRGYFQRQFARLCRNVWPGMIIAAVLFGLSHGYEGGKRMLIIFVMGALFGTLAILRKSLRPGMMGHAIFDTASGIGLMFYDKLSKAGMVK